MTRPVPQPAPAPEPGVAEARAPAVQLPVEPAGRQGSLRRTLWDVDGSAIVGPSRTAPTAFVSVYVSPPLIIGATLARVQEDDVRSERDAPGRLEGGLVRVARDHDVAARRDGRPWRQRIGLGRVRLDQRVAADVERRADGRRRHRAVRGPRRSVAAGVRRAGAEVVLRRGGEAGHRERVRGDEASRRTPWSRRSAVRPYSRRLSDGSSVVQVTVNDDDAADEADGPAVEDRREAVVGPVGRGDRRRCPCSSRPRG